MRNISFSLPKTRILWAILASLFGSLSYAVMLSAVKVSLPSFTTNQIALVRSGVSLSLILICITYCKKKDSYWNFLKTSYLQVHIIRSVTALATIYSFFFALRTISTAEASLLLNTTPVFIPFVSRLWKKTSIDPRVWPGILCAFVGVFCLIHPQSGHFNLGFGIVLVGAAISAVSVVALRSAHSTEPLCRIVFYYTFLSTIVSGFLCFMEGSSWQNLLNARALLGVVSVGISGFMYQILFALSLKYAPVKIIAPFSYVAVIFSLILDYLFWGSQLISIEMIGMVFVLLGLCLIVFLVRKTKEEPAIEAPSEKSTELG